MAKFKFPNVGDICIAEDAVGTRFEVLVRSVNPGAGYPVVVKLLEGLAITRNCGGELSSDLGLEGMIMSFAEDGNLIFGVANDVRLVKVKNPWKKFTKGMKLALGMKVRIKQGDKKFVGKVFRDEGEYHFCIHFKGADDIVYPDESFEHDKNTMIYRPDGAFNWAGDRDQMKAAEKLRIREFK